MTGDGSQGVLASASGGTPKRGYRCGTCEDWGTIVVAHALADGVTEVREVPCPDHTARPADAEEAP